jgi:hypothetical protein
MTTQPKGPLDGDTIHTIKGAALNVMYDDGMKRLEEAVSGYANQLPYSYAEAYWSGWCCAVNGVRDIVRDMEAK